MLALQKSQLGSSSRLKFKDVPWDLFHSKSPELSQVQGFQHSSATISKELSECFGNFWYYGRSTCNWELFVILQYNKFKVRILNEKVNTPTTTVYRCGPLIDLCRGPHVRDTGKVKALKVVKVRICPLFMFFLECSLIVKL